MSCILGPRPWLEVYFLSTGTTSMRLVPMMKGWIFKTYLLLSCILGPRPWLEVYFLSTGTTSKRLVPMMKGWIFDTY